jgi:hypothetical protein
MASDAQDDKPAMDSTTPHPESRALAPRDSGRESVRSPFGPRPLSAVLPALVRPAFRGPAAATAQVLADWASIVGPAYADVTTPQRLSAGTLTIACAGPWAMELQHVAPALMERVNAHLGRVAVTRLRLVQSVPRRPAAPARIAPRPATEAARQAVATLPPGELRDALERLGRVALAPRTP